WGPVRNDVDEAARIWHVDHNAWSRQTPTEPPLDERERAFIHFPVPAADLSAEPEVLSEDSAHRHFYRLAPGDALATAGAGGAWPSYLGALPPGPAPSAGDWFTKLRERWPDRVAVPAIPRPTTVDTTDPLQFPEPAPLAEWLKDRTELTVAQGGS